MQTKQHLEDKKVKLQQKKIRLQLEEAKLKIRERKLRTRHLIELGGLVVKAEIDHLPTSALYGALLAIAEQYKNNDSLIKQWSIKGDSAFNELAQTDKTSIIIKFDQEPSVEIRGLIRQYELKWNRFRQEWYGQVADIESLKAILSKQNIQYEIEIISIR